MAAQLQDDQKIENREVVDRPSKLTRRGQQVAELVALGLSNREIAERIFLSERTVEWHVEQILNRLGFSSRTEIAAWIGRTQSGAPVRLPGGTPRGNLPAPLTSFVGRNSELTALKTLVGSNRLLTIVGPGGTGKTRIALRLAEDLEPEYPDGAWLCDLAPLADPAMVGDAVAQVFGLSRGTTDRLAAAREHLSRLSALLVLDNCEHLVAAASDVAQDLLAACRGLRIVATSLAPLGVIGEAVWRLEPLPEDDAIRLFVERAQAAAPGLRLGVANNASVRSICNRLDGLPLALELTAPRLRSLSVQEVADTLLDAISPQRAGARHGSLESLADWGYRALREDERGLFRRLSVFTGWFEQEDAAAIAPVPAATPMLLTSLVENSMVAVDQISSALTRYRMLETLKAYARKRLAEAGELDDARLSHAERMTSLAESLALRSAGSGRWLGPKMAAFVDDMRAALETLLNARPRRAARLAAALFGFWNSSGRLREGDRWMNAAVAASADGSFERCWLLYRHAEVQLELGKRAEAEHSLAEANILAALPECEGMRAYLLSWRAEVEVSFGNRREAEELYRRAIERFSSGDDRSYAGRSVNGLAMLMLTDGRYVEARDLAERSVALQRGVASPLAAVLDTLAQACALTGEVDRARASWLEAAPLALEDESWAALVSHLEGLAFTSCQRGKTATALLLYGRAHRLRLDIDLHHLEPIAPRVKELMARLEREVGPDAASRLRAAAEALTLPQAIRLAETEG